MAGLMESIEEGWENRMGRVEGNFFDKIIGCCQEISRWRHLNPPYEKEKIAELKKW